MPLPTLVDITLAPDADVAKLKKDISAIAPAASVDDHGAALSGIRRLAGAARGFVYLLTGVIVALAAVSVAGIVRAKFAIHAREVEILHLIGAPDEYIAAQFRRHTLHGVLKGACIGLLSMLAALAAMVFAARGAGGALVPHLGLSPAQWAALLLSPLLAGSLIAHLAAQRAVMKELARLP
jgi:cell division transport system permease protein